MPTHYKQFIAETGADAIIQQIEADILKQNNGQRPVYSDLIKEENGKTYEYVNYVQEGGGVLGVALVGYTYVLEKMGFRFLKLAGTSAGAINTMMLAAVDKKHYTNDKYEYQSEIILQEMLNYDLWQLVDGHWFAKWLIKLFINKPIGTKILKWLIVASIAAPILYALYILVVPFVLTADMIFSGGFAFVTRLLTTVTSIALAVLAATIILVVYFRYRFAKAGYGINPGDKFHAWMNDILQRNNIHNSADLEQAMEERSKGLSLRPERMDQHIAGDNTTIASPYLTIVASDITNQTKVEFPLMAKDYWPQPAEVNPADYVRASMAIPVFFEPFKVEVQPEVKECSRLQQLKASSIDQQNKKAKTVSFVDGGILSNFPINVFHNPNIKVARMPTFGVKLEDETHLPAGEENTTKPTLLRFIGQVFSTIRFYYDRDFLKRNEIYEKCIAHVDVAGHNWLNFGLDYNTKKELFIKGAEAAKAFFLGGKIWIDGKEKDFAAFDWEAFKGQRSKVMDEIKAETGAKEA